MSDHMTPRPDEDEDTFLERCQEGGGSEMACQTAWDDSDDTEDKAGAAVVAGKPLTIRMAANDDAEVLLYGPIGGGGFFDEGGISAKQFRDAVKQCKGKVLNLRVNCPGGSTIEASAMVQALVDWRGALKGRRVETDVDGLAASAASYLVCSSDVTRMAQNALFMIHNPMSMAMGGAEEMRRMADLLDKVKGQILDAYQRKSKMPRAELSKMMDAETWMTGAEAVTAGFADSCGAPVQVAAFAGMAELLAKLHYKHAPQLPAVDAQAVAETARRRKIAAALTTLTVVNLAGTQVAACGGEGSGVPGPCPEKGDDQGGATKTSEAEYGKPNAALPDAARPALTAKQGKAANLYTKQEYIPINKALRSGKSLEGKSAKVDAELQAALKEAKPFDKPVTVYRGLQFQPGKNDLPKLLDKMKEATGTGKALQFAGYSSTTTNEKNIYPEKGEESAFAGGVVLEIEAAHGLDMKSFSDHPNEDELLLNHNSRFTVESVEQRKDANGGLRWHAKLKQVL